MKITKDLMIEFINFYKNRNFKPGTIRAYELEIQRFLERFYQLGLSDTEQITMKIIEEYKTLLAKNKCSKNSIYYGRNRYIAPRTIQCKLQPVKKFLEFLNVIYNTGLNYQYIKVPKVHSKHMDFFEVSELDDIMKAIDETEKYPIARARAKLLVVLGFTSGMRIGEMVQLTAGDIMKGRKNIIGKGNKEREVYFNDHCKKLMQEYMECRKLPLPATGKVGKKKCKENWAFISHNPKTFGKPVSIETLCGHNHDINQNLHIQGKKFTAHTMRHSSATYMLDNGANIREVQEFLGHSHLETTQGYTHIRNSQIENVHNRVFGEI